MRKLPEQLIKKLHQNNVVIFVGAGLSMGAGLPNWTNLICSILDGLVEKEPKSEKYKQALLEDLFPPIDILDKIQSHKTAAIEIFEAELRKFDTAEPTKIHLKLNQLSNKIITTNYDSLLEKAFPDFEKINYTYKYKVAKLSEYERYIFKIHGDLQEPDNCILFPSEYKSLYSEEEKSAIFELKKIISEKSILFIGFSLSDPYINFVFEFINKLYSGFSPENYILTTDKGKTWPSKVNPILIDNNNDDLEAALDELIFQKTQLLHSHTIIEADIKKVTNDVVTVVESLEYDSPPINKIWIGRQRELENINNDNFKVIFITGIGGQGKSSLAAHYLLHHFNNNIYDFGDWRDFKEESNRFQTKLISLVKRLQPDYDNVLLEYQNGHQLVDTFFQVLDKKKIVFVFDNVDSYIDLEKFRPAGPLGYLFEQALSRNHNSKFIFTCRPFIREAGVNFYQISLTGLSEQECEELFLSYKVPISKDLMERFVKRAHKITKGHPLWLSIIAGQAIRGAELAEQFLKKIEDKTSFDEDDFSAILSEKILYEVWGSLNDKQRILLRAIAETVKPEKEEDLRTILGSELNPNQFGRSLRTIKNLNLVEDLSEGEIELHPLVKEFIRVKYPRNERSKFITLFVQYYDKFIYILKPRLSAEFTIEEFQNWTLKIELHINKGDYQPALVVLEEVSHPIITAGFSEEYLRVAEKLFDTIDWKDAVNKEYTYFHSQFRELITVQTQMGRFDASKNNLDKYSKLMSGKNSNYIALCSLKCYNFWYQGQFDEAIEIGEEGVALIDDSDLADNYMLKHNLALAYRDSQIPHNIDKAMNYFLMNQELVNILDKNNLKLDLGGHVYGNVGKCLEYSNRIDDALTCYLISFKALLNESHINSLLNIGYACKWIAEALIIKGDEINALKFLKYSKNNWDKTSPHRSKEIDNIWEVLIVDKEVKNEIDVLSNWKVEKDCKDFMIENLF